jgi:carbonic anhydrase
MLVDDILENNRRFIREYQAQPLPPPETIPLAVVACYDPRLDALVHRALGLLPGEAFVLRTAGALVQPQGGVMRSLMLAVFMFGVRHILVVGHTSCRMAAFDTAAFIDAFRSRGVPREAFGPGDLRSWAGAIPGVREGVLLSIASIRGTPCLPRDVSVGGAILDDTSGRLEVVVQPAEPVPSPKEAVAPPAVEPPPTVEPEERPPPEAPEAKDELVQAVRTLGRILSSTKGFRPALGRVRNQLERSTNPLEHIDILEKQARAVGAESADILAAFQHLRREVAQRRGRPEWKEVIQLLRELTRP